MKKFKNQYRVQSTRLQSWDYGHNGAYFVTACTKRKVPYLGNIVAGEMHLSPAGLLAERFFREIPLQFPYANPECCVVMPNHVHLVILMFKSEEHRAGFRRDAIHRVYSGGMTGGKNPMCHENLSRIIRWYKGRVTFETRRVIPEFAWQPRFYEHVIRNDKSFNEISAYVKTNPQRWENDKFYIKCSRSSQDGPPDQLNSVPGGETGEI